MWPRLTLLLCIYLPLLLAGCGDAVEPEDEAPVESAVAPVVFPPGDPRNAVLNQVRYPNHGDEKDLGLSKIGGARVKVTQYGPIMEGGEAHFMLDPSPTEVGGIYVWIGNEDDGKKRRWPAAPEPGGYHVHCAVPRPLDDEHALWIELRMENGERYRGQIYIGDG